MPEGGEGSQTWFLKYVVTALCAVVLALAAYEWKGLAGDVEQNREDITEVQRAITKMEAYQEQDKTQQGQQTEILQEMLRTMKAAGTAREEIDGGH